MNQILKSQLLQRHLNLLSSRDIWTESPKHTSKSNRSNSNPRPAVNNRRGVQNNYDKLGIGPKASQKDIKSAYYSLSKTCHPDVNQSSEAAHQFREITEAYDVLSNEESKRTYDLTIGNNYRERRSFDNLDVNQHNLDKYRGSRKFGDKKFTDNEDYSTHKWKKRNRNMNMEQKYKDMNEEENKKRYRYVDPLKYDPKTFYSQHFNDEIQKKFAEEIDKRDEKYREALEEWRSDLAIKMLMVSILFMIPVILHFLGNEYNLYRTNDPSLMANYSPDSDNDNNSKWRLVEKNSDLHKEIEPKLVTKTN